ncbi:hypothetical protein BK816_06960 [Boudabousia tangfeifanii]|uniref:SLH domain-containing protein n=1 Tax=Boudabousia tangfeifanii TaxID=1912795 RepID=A0A1D9MLK2_9ACTO|nr:family 43 glycosylhydrolase [Boudabousia tangfeifanii]AOZ73059.1 hypothetical protein BK816_06960 [Boudabousia tangfeifanii]
MQNLHSRTRRVLAAAASVTVAASLGLAGATSAMAADKPVAKDKATKTATAEPKAAKTPEAKPAAKAEPKKVDKVLEHEPFNKDTNFEYVDNFPDPDIYFDKDTKTYYAFSTTAKGALAPVVTSKDLKVWSDVDGYKPPKNPKNGRYPLKYLRAMKDNWGNAIAEHFVDGLLDLPVWTSAPNSDKDESNFKRRIWAPTVEKLDNGNYLMVFAVEQAPESKTLGYGRWCLSYAVATKELAAQSGRKLTPAGPYADTTSKPLYCSDDPAGTIDPDLFRDPKTGQLYLLAKNEGNNKNGFPGGAAKLHVHKVKQNGNTISLEGKDTVLSYAQMEPWREGYEPGMRHTWEGLLNENPSMVYYKGKYYLFYSANEYKTADYATGYSICETPMGPCKRVSTQPLLKADKAWNQLGPGGASAFVDTEGKLRLAYHAYPAKMRDDKGNLKDVTNLDQTPRVLQVGTLDTYDKAGRLVITERSNRLPADVAAPKTGKFIDINKTTDHYAAMVWMDKTGIATGWAAKGGRTYRPTTPVTREAMAAFIYRAAGSPIYTPPANSADCFKDISKSAFSKQICWMKESGLSKGWPDKTFRPNDPISREAMAAFMYRLAKSPKFTPVTKDGFVDLSKSYFKKEMQWMQAAGIANGWKVDGKREYRPAVNVNRDAMAVFLKNMVSKYSIKFDGTKRL